MALRPRDILTDIADAIRERGNLAHTVLIRPTGTPNGFAARIRSWTVGTGTNPDARRFFHFRDFLTPAEEQERNLWRLDGRPLYSTVNAGTHTLFKVGSNWQGGFMTFPPPSPATRAFDNLLVVGNNLYVGSSTASTVIVVINTTNGTITQITGLPSRSYSRFDVSGNFIYCLHPGSSISSFNTIVRINTTNNTFIQITLAGSASWNGFAKIGNKWFLASRNNSVNYLPFIDISTEPPTAGSIPNVTSAARTQHIIIGPNNKIYLSAGGGSSTTFLVVINAATNTVVQEIVGLPNRPHDASLLCGRYLYITSSGTTARDTIVCIDTNSEFGEELTVPSRRYSLEVATQVWAFCGVLVGNKVYVGFDWNSATTLVVINNTTRATGELTLPATRVYRLVPQQEFVNWRFDQTAPQLQRAHITGTTAGSKIYLSSSQSSDSSIIMITTNAAWPPTDAVTQITGFPSRTYDGFYVNGTTMYLISESTASTIEMVNLSTDTRITTPISGLTSRSYRSAPVAWGAGAAARLYFGGGTWSVTNLPVINSSTNTLVENITGLESRPINGLALLNNKIYVDSATSSFANMLVLSDSVLPRHSLPVYIRPD